MLYVRCCWLAGVGGVQQRVSERRECSKSSFRSALGLAEVAHRKPLVAPNTTHWRIGVRTDSTRRLSAVEQRCQQSKRLCSSESDTPYNNDRYSQKTMADFMRSISMYFDRAPICHAWPFGSIWMPADLFVNLFAEYKSARTNICTVLLCLFLLE